MPAKYTQEQVKNIFANAGCKLLSQYYTVKEPVQYCCSCGNISFITLSNLLQGQRCNSCGQLKATQKKTLRQEYVERYFKDHGCELLDLYINNKILIKYRCSCGSIAFIRFDSFQQGHRCTVCGRIKTTASHTKEKSNFWNPDREQVQRNKELRAQQNTLLHNCMKRLGTSKEGHTDELLGYSALELDQHLRSFPMYVYLQDTHTLAIDHIFPVQAFIDHGIKIPRIICALDNLQPLSRSENLEKSDWYLEKEFLAYCQKHNIVLLAEAI